MGNREGLYFRHMSFVKISLMLIFVLVAAIIYCVGQEEIFTFETGIEAVFQKTIITNKEYTFNIESSSLYQPGFIEDVSITGDYVGFGE